MMKSKTGRRSRRKCSIGLFSFRFATLDCEQDTDAIERGLQSERNMEITVKAHGFHLN